MTNRELKQFHAENRTHVTEKGHEGTELKISNAANAPVGLTLYANAEQKAKYYQANGGSIQEVTENSPSPEYPSEITPEIAAGTYQITLDDGIYELTLPDMYGVGNYCDKVIIDEVSKTAKLKREMKFYTPSSISTYAHWTASNSLAITFGIYDAKNLINQQLTKCTHALPSEILYTSTKKDGTYVYNNNTTYIYIRTTEEPLISTTTKEEADEWLKAQADAGTPLRLLYPLATPTYTELELTKVTGSNAPELTVEEPAESLTPSSEYPHRIYKSGYILKCANGDGVSEVYIPDGGYAVEVSDSESANLEKDGKYYAADVLEYDEKENKVSIKRYIDESLFDYTKPISEQTEVVRSEPEVEEIEMTDTEYNFGDFRSLQDGCKVTTEADGELLEPLFIKAKVKVIKG